jgi:hypothetical protein
MENFGYPAISELCKSFYYGGKDSLSAIFPNAFKSLPQGCLVMACTCVRVPLFFFSS